jgi:uncharacterized spore protein YtfJ
MAKLQELMSTMGDTFTVSRVYGEPYEKDGVTFIPAASIRGGGGGGEGEAGEQNPAGSGGGFGVVARPVGAYQIKDGELTWVPAFDVTKVVVMAQAVAIAGLLVIRSIARRRRRG